MNEVEIRKALESAGLTWEQFSQWMSGQTVSLDEYGETNFYTYDVKRFIEAHRKR